MDEKITRKLAQASRDYDLLIQTAQAIANNTRKPVGIIAFAKENPDHTGTIVWEYTQNIEYHSDRVVRIIEPIIKEME